MAVLDPTEPKRPESLINRLPVTFDLAKLKTISSDIGIFFFIQTLIRSKQIFKNVLFSLMLSGVTIYIYMYAPYGARG